MKTKLKIPRRQFLQGAPGALGLLALGGAVGERSRAAQSKPWLPKDLAALEKRIEEMEADSPRYLAVAKPDGRFLNLLIRAARAGKALEIGTAHGYAAIWMRMGLEETGGRLTTIEILPDRAAAARRHVSQAGLSDRVTFEEGDAHQVVSTLSGPFDFVLLAADKDGYVDYFNKLLPKKLAPGALLVVPGAIKQREKMKAYLDLISSHPEFDTVVVSATMEDGFAVSCRKR
jgi:caffeoyl-CoA O-methyltransferase